MTRLGHHADARVETGADGDDIDAVEHLGAEGASDDLGQRRILAQRLDPRRLRAAVGDAHARAPQRAPARHCQPRLAEPQHQDVFSGQCTHRSFSVDRPNSTSMMVMIQKRTTTCVSFQPLSS